MSANYYNREPAASAYRGPLRARVAGERAALGMGAGASLILAAAALLIRVPAPAPAFSTADIDAPPAQTAPAKISAKASTDLESALGKPTTAAALDIDAPEYAQEKKVVAVGEPKDGAPRVDTITIGQFGAGAPYLRVDVHPEPDPKVINADFFLDLKNHAQTAGLTASKIVGRATTSTRFGAFETADIRLSQPDGEGAASGERACIAGRLVDAKTPVKIVSIACGPAARPMDRVALACALDKLNYAPGGDNNPLNDFLLRAELARGKGCANVSREDLTATIPAQKPARAKPAHVKKPRPAPRPAPVAAEEPKN